MGRGVEWQFEKLTISRELSRNAVTRQAERAEPAERAAMRRTARPRGKKSS